MKKFVEKGKKMITLFILAMAVMCGTALAANIDAIVPASLPITVSADGSVVTATNASIQNYGSEPLLVSSINVAGQNGWSLATKETAATASIGDKVIAMAFNGQWSDTNGAVNVASFDKIAAKRSLPLKYDAKAPAAKTAESEEAATATFVVKDLSAPTMAAGSSWYKTSKERSTITKITFMDSYTPSTAVDQIWFADVDDTGSITCYLTGTEIIIAGNGSGKIKANTDSSYMFASTDRDYFTKLTAIEELNLLNTSQTANMSNMFSACMRLTSLSLSNFDTSHVTSMSSMFHNCISLLNIDMSSFDTECVTDMSNMFFGCRKLADIDISSFNTSCVTDMSGMFVGCKTLTNIDVSNFNTSNVTNMSRLFDSCSAVTNLDTSHFDTSKVTSMTSMFKACSSLTFIDISNFNTSNVTNMGGMFISCKNITSLDLSNFDTSNVTDMYEMFYHCSELTTIYASDKWNTDKVTDSNNMFSGCTELKGDIAFNSNYIDKTYAKIIGGYLTGPTEPPTLAANYSWYKSLSNNRNSITKITFMDSYTPTGAENESWNADEGGSGSIKGYCIGWEVIIAGNGSGSIKTNADSSQMFSYWSSNSGFTDLKEIVNLNLLDTSDTTNMTSMFYNCAGLTCLDLSSFDTSKVTSTASMFSKCTSLSTIYASTKWNMENVTSSSSMFNACTSLKGDIAYNGRITDKTYATIKDGYLTNKVATTKMLTLNIDPNTGTVTSYDVSTSPMSTYKEMIRAVAAA
ncbi:BspA family leucine-rich repeat surface protein [Butyricicoccus sp. AF22-28AC]|nr:BspA family leucine-rich repeat surface protein [Butyricicoccus sp. AF22-28AC]RHQ84270.1 BspA family leucine-rich repeat surface protein [Butyricicoccus sp. AF22-28AC]